ncbi:potassium transporter [Pararhodospirillum oryzae]|uniref:Potassium transporter n=2 Tax=Pararhodospirillum oryzae TaxID=478448 RepID=A0A512H761_9PROT|nr:potassium transporter [Pararhodospirillum oryzae]
MPLADAVIYLAAAVLSVPIARQLGLGSVLGYLIAGVVIGPGVLGLVGEAQSVRHVAEFGVVMMLFLVGLELRPARLWSLKGTVFGLGGAQVLGCAAALGLGLLAWGVPWPAAVFGGLAGAMSSTAIVLQALAEKGLLRTRAGEVSFSVLLFQDLAVIPIMALLPLLAGGAGAEASAHPSALAGLPGWVQALATLAAVAAIGIGGRLLTRPAFRFIARTRLREIFTAFALLLVLATALLMSAVGLSAALGTFLAGVVLADSEFRHELESDIEPFKGLLLGLFFLSVGAGIDLHLLTDQVATVAALVGAIVGIKIVVLGAVLRAMRLTGRDALLSALALSQVGEFAFVLIGLAGQAGLFDARLGGLMTLAVALSMVTTPLLLLAFDHFATDKEQERPQGELPSIPAGGRVILAGFGRVGQIGGRLLMARGVNVTVLEHDADQLESLRPFGFSLHYGDARRADLLASAGAAEADLLMVATDDKETTLTIVETARRHFPGLKIAARAFDRVHAYALEDAGANLVVRETFAGALDLGVGALRLLGVPAYEARRAGHLFARHDQEIYDSLRTMTGDSASWGLAFRAKREHLERILKQEAGEHDTLGDDGWETATAAQPCVPPGKGGDA